MTTTPQGPTSDEQGGDDAGASTGPSAAPSTAPSTVPGAEIGISEGEGSSFEPEEDPEGHD